MEYVLYYLLGIVIAFVLISVGLWIGNEYENENDTIGPVLIAGLVFPITLMIMISIIIYIFGKELFKRILK